MAQDIERVGVVTGGGALGEVDGYGIGNAVARLLGRSGVAIAVAFAPPAVGLTACLLIAALATLLARGAGAYRF